MKAGKVFQGNKYGSQSPRDVNPGERDMGHDMNEEE